MKIKHIKILLICLTAMALNISWAFVISKTESGKNIKWKKDSLKIPMRVNPRPLKDDMILDIDSSTAISLYGSRLNYLEYKSQQIIQESIDTWNKNSAFTIIPVYTNDIDEQSSISYSSDSFNFGPGVIAVTKLSFDSVSGSIYSADIILNQSNLNFISLSVDKSQSSKEKAYIGDVLSHEIGHLFGLGHSEVINSSMVFSIFKGQHKVHTDDVAGVNKNYNIHLNKGVLKGAVKAGQGTPVFGVHVSLLSARTNQVLQGQITNENGEFIFENLDLNESYYVMTSPIKKKASLPEYYKNVNDQICFQQKYATSFFSKCGARSKSTAQAFFLSEETTEIDVGTITLRCDENISVDYYAHKFQEEDYYEYNMLQDKISKVFYGYFSDTEINKGLTGKGDWLKIDLRSLDPGGFVLNDYKVKLNFTSVGIGSSFEFVIYAKRDDQATWKKYESSYDVDTGKKLVDQSVELALSASAENNIFYIKVFPLKLETNDFYEIFSSINVLNNKNQIYTIVSQLGVKDTFSSYNYDLPDSYPYSDNEACLEGNITYSSSPYIPLKAKGNTAQSSDDDAVVSCGTIDSNSGSGPKAMISFLISFVLVFLSLNIRNIQLNSLSKS
ncbi:MAG: matrixin family metalloprotease [Bacteriovoracaceae bacterium]|jgi:hypothetical protein|nr:hypothetical protein [Halobacteriovoraceae bacterium]MDP7321320.1 matrixin family metalloprotease [Bacteriovoracaceae bacterium]